MTAATTDWRKSRAELLDRESARRTIEFEKIELRADGANSVVHLRGYASVTETPYDMGWYTETVGRGAFKKTLSQNPDVVLNIGHGTNASGLPIARTKAGTLRLEEDSKGLRVDADLDPEDPDVQLLKRKMDRGDLDGQMSFAFTAPRSEWNSDYTERRITEANIHRGDVSIVTQGANPATSSSVRSLAAMQDRMASERSLAEYDDRLRVLRIGAHRVALPARKLDEFERRIWAQRAKVFHIPLRPGTKTCPRCKGKKTVAPNGVDIKCPTCLGAGSIKK